LNYTSFDGALLILKGSKCPKFDLLSDTYEVKTYEQTKVFEDTVTKTQKKTEYDRVLQVNALLKYRLAKNKLLSSAWLDRLDLAWFSKSSSLVANGSQIKPQ
jgi:hypothetical protein